MDSRISSISNMSILVLGSIVASLAVVLVVLAMTAAITVVCVTKIRSSISNSSFSIICIIYKLL